MGYQMKYSSQSLQVHCPLVLQSDHSASVSVELILSPTFSGMLHPMWNTCSHWKCNPYKYLSFDFRRALSTSLLLVSGVAPLLPWWLIETSPFPHEVLCPILSHSIWLLVLSYRNLRLWGHKLLFLGFALLIFPIFRRKEIACTLLKASLCLSSFPLGLLFFSAYLLGITLPLEVCPFSLYPSSPPFPFSLSLFFKLTLRWCHS